MKTFIPVKAALMGCGMISNTYLKNCVGKFNGLDVVGCSDIIQERSEQRAEEFKILNMTGEDILSDSSIEMVINTTFPTTHYEVSKAALLAGKHVYTEKMMAVTLEEGRELCKIAKEKNLHICAAPDTFLGAGLQTARRIIDSGFIGEPVAANAIVVRGYRHDRFRTEPEKRFAFCPGGGIIFDMGSYYLTGLISLLGPIKRVCGFSQTREPERIYRHPKNSLYGQNMNIETPNNTAGTLEFKNGVLCSILTSSEGINAANNFVIYGTEGTLMLNDPNTFGGPILLRSKMESELREMPLAHAFTTDMRGLGAVDLAYAIRNNRRPRTVSDMPLHVLEAALGICQSNENGKAYVMTSTCDRPEPLVPGYTEYPEMVFDI